MFRECGAWARLKDILGIAMVYGYRFLKASAPPRKPEFQGSSH